MQTCGSSSPSKIRKKKCCIDGPVSKSAIFGLKMAKKASFGSVWYGFENPTSNSEVLEFLAIIKWCQFLVFWPKSKNGIFWRKKDCFSLFGCISHLALLFYRLNIHELSQTFRNRCKILISGGPYKVYWTRLEKL